MSPLGQRKCGLLRQVIALKRFNSFENSITGHEMVIFKYIWMLNGGDSMGRFDCTWYFSN
jgi:hypothetical protein